MAEFEIAGATFRGGKMFAVLTALSTLGGGAWAGFEFYKDYMDMKEIVQNIDVDAIAAENALVIQKIDESMIRIEEAIEYTRDIKNDLKDDIMKIENVVDKNEANVEAWEDRTKQTIENIELKMEASEDRIKETQRTIEDTLELIRTDMNQIQKDVTASIREVEATLRESEKDVRDTMKDTVADLEFKMDDLEDDINKQIEEALDNPLND
jgi:gas vesicle protein